MVELKRQNRKENTKIYNDTLKKLRRKLGKAVPINHVGSTALPNMYGKNIIDILIGAKDIEELKTLATKIEEMGFFISKNNKEEIYKFFSSREEETKSGDIHIHLALINSDRYNDFLILKNYLLNNKEERDNYTKIKKDIIKGGHIKRDKYKKIKSEYVEKLIKRARLYYYNENKKN